LGRVYTCGVARFGCAGDGEWMVAQGAERASALCAEREGEREKERKRERESDEWINGGVLGVMIGCFLVLWWTSEVAGSVCGRARVLGMCIVEGCVWGHEVAGRAGGGRCGGAP
jgi:hypothetical protein